MHAFGGEVLKFMGDGVLAIFPVAGGSPRNACDAALKAVAAARSGMAHLDEARARDGLPPLPFGVALHLGEMLWGNIGAADRLDFTAIGPAVNLVSRLEGLCRPLERTVLVSGAFAAETDGAADPARNARVARHCLALRRVHGGGLIPHPSGERPSLIGVAEMMSHFWQRAIEIIAVPRRGRQCESAVVSREVANRPA